MPNTNTIAKVFDTVLSVPGMSDNVKIQLSMPRKNLLSKVIERGLSAKDNSEESDILHMAPKETMEELTEISNDLLKKAGLMEMNEKLNALK